MSRSRLLLRALGLLAFLLCSSTGRAALPYRFLVVISDQWKDPASYVIQGGDEFAILVGLLKTWGLPFDILRLDQQRFDRYYLLDREGQPRYGTIIWDAGPDGLKERGVEFLETLVRDHGVSLVALRDTIAARQVGGLAGLEHVSEYALATDLAVAREHFITRDLKGREKEFLSGGGRQRGDKVLVQGATVLIARGALPFLAVREFDRGGRVAWIDAHRPSAQLARQIVRDLFKRCLVWAQGYALYAEYPKSIILEMHDAGASDKTFLPYWHYPNLTEKQIRERIIAPLKRHKAVLAQVVNTGYVDRKTERVLNPWKQERVLDELDGKTIHDYASLKRGLDAGLREGVFEIQSHGWTHMLPDLDSPPGPFWNAPLDGVATLGWDNEFGDRIRGREIPAVTQKLHLQRSIEYIQEDFGVTPLFIRPGGGEFSRTYANHTGRIAAQLGFGLARLSSPFYLGPELVIALGPAILQRTWAYDQRLSAADIPWTVDGPFFLAFHDRDVALDPGAIERLLEGLGDGVRYMTPDEYCGYLHAEVERAPAAGDGLSLTVRYRRPYGRFFASRSSVWTLHLADETRRWLKESPPEKRTVEIPPGLGPHTLAAALFAQVKPAVSPAYRAYETANTLFVAKKFSECQQALEEALRLDPKLVPALTLKAKLAMAMNRFDIARQALEQALAVDPSSWYAHFLYGFQYHLQNDLQLALPELEKARKLNPRDARPAIYLGLTHESLGHTGEALGFYEEAIRLEAAAGKAQADTLLTYSRFLLVLGRLEECGRLIERALELDPNSRDVHFERGRWLIKRGDAAGAAREGEKALRLPASGIPDRQIRYLLVRAYRMSGQERLAEEHAAALRAAEVQGERDLTPHIE